MAKNNFSKRLGAGLPGSDYDIFHLKSHPFFIGISWNHLYKLNVPMNKI